MDPITALGVAGNVVQLLDSGIRLTRELLEYVKISPGDVPKSVESINTQLPLLLNSLARLKDSAEVEKYERDTRYILHGVVVGCFKLVSELDEIISKIRPLPGEKLTLKLKKALKAIKKEERILEIERGLQAYIQVLILHQVVDRGEVQLGPPDEPDYFEVKEKRIKDPVKREQIMEKLDSHFYQAARSRRQTPQFVILQGDKGVGKSQIALEYCYQSYELGQFRTIFWLDAGSPHFLTLSLEGVAAVIRHSKAGTSKEKLDFVNKFLTERWHPWLLVLDNYNHKAFDGEPLTRYIPETGYGAILITTRNLELPGLGTFLKIYKFLTPEEEVDARNAFGKALRDKDLLQIKDSLERGFNPNSMSTGGWPGREKPFVNIAAQMSFPEGVKVLLEHGADPGLIKGHITAPGDAVYANSLPVINTFLDHEDITGSYMDNKAYKFLFQYAIELGHLDILKVLLKRRGQEFDPDDSFMRNPFKKATERGNLEILRYLVSIDRLPKSDTQRASLLSAAINGRQLEIAKFLIHGLSVDPNELDQFGLSSLYEAMTVDGRTGDAEIRGALLPLLLGAGASPNIGNPEGRTALHQAAAIGDLSAIKILLEAGADVTIEDEDKNTPLLRAANFDTKTSYELLSGIKIPNEKLHARYYSRALFRAAEIGDRELALVALKETDIDARDTETEDTPLLVAIKYEKVPVARMLVRKGARQDLRDRDGKLPMILAAETGLDLVVRDLAKAKNTLGVEVADQTGNTPLILAARSNHEKTVKELLNLGADKDAMNQFGEIALDFAEEKDFEEIIKVLDR